MHKSLQEVRDIVNDWKRESLPIKLSFLDAKGSKIWLLLRCKVWGFEGDTVRVGVEGTADLFIPLTGATFDLEDATEAPEHLRAETLSRTVRCLTCTLPFPSGALVHFYELWADVELKPE